MTQETPNVEAIVIEALLADSGVDAVVGDRVYGKRPSAATDPMLVIHRAGGPLTGDWLEQARIQIDAWGTTQADAWAAAAAASSALIGLSGTYTHGVLAGVSRTVGPQPLQDPVTARDRYVTEYIVNAHPNTA